jgi:hypothetical protein
MYGSAGTKVYVLETNLLIIQAVLRTLAVWPWDVNNAKEAEFSIWLREALTVAIEQGDSESNTVSSVRRVIPI